MSISYRIVSFNIEHFDVQQVCIGNAVAAPGIFFWAAVAQWILGTEVPNKLKHFADIVYRGVFKPQLGKKVEARCSSLEYDRGLNALLTYDTDMTSL